MARTPEGKVKDEVKKVLKRHKAYWFCPVQNGMGTRALDFIGVVNGKGFGIETKAGNKGPTAQQQLIMEDMSEAGAGVFLINAESGLDEFDSWCLQVSNLAPQPAEG